MEYYNQPSSKCTGSDHCHADPLHPLDILGEVLPFLTGVLPPRVGGQQAHGAAGEENIIIIPLLNVLEVIIATRIHFIRWIFLAWSCRSLLVYSGLVLVVGGLSGPRGRRIL